VLGFELEHWCRELQTLQPVQHLEVFGSLAYTLVEVLQQIQGSFEEDSPPE
jgi:hypothetical protein